MPAFQMLEPAPSFGGQLGAALGGGISQGLGTAVSQHLQKKQTASQFEGLKPFLKQTGLSDLEIDSISKSGLPPQQVLAAVKAIEPVIKQRQEVQKQEGKKESAQAALTRAGELLQSHRLGARIPFSKGDITKEESREARAEFNTIMSEFEAALVPIINPKGTMSDVRFKYIVKQLLPTDTDTEATIRGKLKALAQKLHLDDSSILKKGKELSEIGQNRPSLEDIFSGR